MKKQKVLTLWGERAWHIGNVDATRSSLFRGYTWLHNSIHGLLEKGITLQSVSVTHLIPPGQGELQTILFFATVVYVGDLPGIPDDGLLEVDL